MGTLGLFRPFVSLGKTILHIFLPTMTTKGDPPYYGIPKQGLSSRDAADWYEAIQGGILSTRDLENVTISKVKWFKDNRGVAHECLVFTVNVENPEYEAFLAIERSTTQEIVESALQGDNALELISEETAESLNDNQKQRALGTLRPKLKEELKQIKARANRYTAYSKPVTMSSRISKFNSLLVAEDVITRVDLGDGSEPTEHSMQAKCLNVLTFDAKRFSLRDLGIMVREVHALRKDYTLRRYNCYWFARTLVDVMEILKTPKSATPKIAEEKAGFVPGIPTRLVRSNPDEVAQLVVRIQDAIRADDERIAQLKDNAELVKNLAETLARERQQNEDKLSRERLENEDKLYRERLENEDKLSRERQEFAESNAATHARIQEAEAEVKRLQAQLSLKSSIAVQ